MDLIKTAKTNPLKIGLEKNFENTVKFIFQIVLDTDFSDTRNSVFHPFDIISKIEFSKSE